MTVRRIKSYTGQTGYVYQYYFVGKRTALDYPEIPATEFIFDVTPDRKTMFSVSVFVQQDALEHWASTHGRGLSDAEQYASAKMRLFHAFDELGNMMAEGRQLQVDATNIEELLDSLNLG